MEPLTTGGLSRRAFLGHGASVGLAVTGTAALAGCGSQANHDASAQSGPPPRGGTLIVGVGGGGPGDTLDPHFVADVPSGMYVFSLYDQLTLVDEHLQLTHRLAEELTPSSDARTWTLRLRQGVEFHNGKTLDADDVIYTFKRIANPKTHATLAWLTARIASMQRLDSRTVKFELKEPMGWFDLAIGDGGALDSSIVPVGFDPQHPIGTGPFKLVSFAPGQRAVFERFPNYWGGAANLDRLEILTLNDDTARMNALVSGQININANLLPTQVAQVQGTSGLELYKSRSGGCQPFTMRTDIPPFNDVRVRQAMRLSVDRQTMVESVSAGYADIGADLYSPYDPDYDKSLHREQDIEQAKSLLRQAGRSDLSVQLVVSTAVTNSVNAAQVLAHGAQAAGINVNIREVDASTLFGPNFLSWPFAVDIWGGLRILTTATLADSPVATTNETHFSDPAYGALWRTASSTLDANKRSNALHDMQQILFDRGGYLIPMFAFALGAHGAGVGGYPPEDLRGYGIFGTSPGKLFIRT